MRLKLSLQHNLPFCACFSVPWDHLPVVQIGLHLPPWLECWFCLASFLAPTESREFHQNSERCLAYPCTEERDRWAANLSSLVLHIFTGRKFAFSPMFVSGGANFLHKVLACVFGFFRKQSALSCAYQWCHLTLVIFFGLGVPVSSNSSFLYVLGVFSHSDLKAFLWRSR